MFLTEYSRAPLLMDRSQTHCNTARADIWRAGIAAYGSCRDVCGHHVFGALLQLQSMRRGGKTASMRDGF